MSPIASFHVSWVAFSFCWRFFHLSFLYFWLLPCCRRYRFASLAYFLQVGAISFLCLLCARIWSYKVTRGIFFTVFSSASLSRPISPLAAEHPMIMCRLHVLFRISLTSSQCCRRSASVCPLRGAYVVRSWMGILEFLRPIVTRATLLPFLAICVIYFCALSRIGISVPPCTTPVLYFLAAPSVATL